MTSSFPTVGVVPPTPTREPGASLSRRPARATSSTERHLDLLHELSQGFLDIEEEDHRS